MSRNDTPRGREQVIVAALIVGKTPTEVATLTDRSTATVHRVRRKHSQLIEQGRQDVAEAAAALLLDSTSAAAARMSALIHSDSESVALAASRYTLDSALRWRDAIAIEKRISALEESML